MMELAVTLLCAIVSFTISIRSFLEKGFVLNNAYIFASEEERKALDKAPLYRQTAIVCGLSGVMFLLIALMVLTGMKWLFYAACVVAVITLVYAIASSKR